MKNLKRIASLMLALLIVLSMMPAAFAEEATGNGTITITGVSTDVTYEIYKLLDLESYDNAAGAYSYTVNSAWAGFFALEDTLKYVKITDGYVTWIATESDAVAFAQKALAYAEDNGIEPVQSSENEGQLVITDGAGKFSGLELGYYLIDSTLGALCGLTTTNPNGYINSKNGAPTIDKQVQEDSTTNWGASNTADVGQTVNYHTTINVHDGAQNYVLHDKMSGGLTFAEESVVIEHVIPSVSGDPDIHIVPPADYTVKTDDLTDDCTFEIEFSDELLAKLETNDKLIVYYSAVVNKDAVIGEDGNPNEAWLDFGEGNHTTHDTTTTYTYGFDIVKTDETNKTISGAEFLIYDAETGGNVIPVVPLVTVAEGEDEYGARVTEYVRAGEGETGETIVLARGAVRVEGFDNGTYYLEEVKTPDGYNKLTSRQKFIISDGNLYSVFSGSDYSAGSGIQVVNKTGTMLPQTGGIGTTLFYVIGGVLVAAAVVLLVTRKRMSEK